MVYPPELLDALESMGMEPWRGTVFRHMFNDFPPERENTRGARWNPPKTGAIYTSLKSETALAEIEYHLSLQPVRPSVSRHMFTVDVEVEHLVDLSTDEALQAAGLDTEALAATYYATCQTVGGAVAWLGCGGMLVPSARAHGVNLVLFPHAGDNGYSFEVTNDELL